MEYFDSKYTSILPLQIDYSIGAKDSEFEFWYADMVLVNTMFGKLLFSPHAISSCNIFYF